MEITKNDKDDIGFLKTVGNWSNKLFGPAHQANQYNQRRLLNEVSLFFLFYYFLYILKVLALSSTIQWKMLLNCMQIFVKVLIETIKLTTYYHFIKGFGINDHYNRLEILNFYFYYYYYYYYYYYI